MNLVIDWTVSADSLSPSQNKARECSVCELTQYGTIMSTNRSNRGLQRVKHLRHLKHFKWCRCCRLPRGGASVLQKPTPLHHPLIRQLCAANTDRPGSFMALYNSNLMVDVITQYEPLPQWLPAAFSILQSLIGRWLHEEKRNNLHIKWCVCLLCEKPIHGHHSAQTF